MRLRDRRIKGEGHLGAAERVGRLICLEENGGGAGMGQEWRAGEDWGSAEDGWPTTTLEATLELDKSKSREIPRLAETQDCVGEPHSPVVV